MRATIERRMFRLKTISHHLNFQFREIHQKFAESSTNTLRSRSPLQVLLFPPDSHGLKQVPLCFLTAEACVGFYHLGFPRPDARTRFIFQEKGRLMIQLSINGSSSRKTGFIDTIFPSPSQIPLLATGFIDYHLPSHLISYQGFQFTVVELELD
ncbi:hypothetical protein L1887_35659 [Cichorium endivia]|nr:hypothetical protein L1887_35659 [Cichorium endivia]